MPFVYVAQFAPEVHVGDGIGMDLKLSNHVYNALKRHCQTEQRRSARLHEKKEHSTAVSPTRISALLHPVYEPPTLMSLCFMAHRIK